MSADPAAADQHSEVALISLSPPRSDPSLQRRVVIRKNAGDYTLETQALTVNSSPPPTPGSECAFQIQCTPASALMRW